MTLHRVKMCGCGHEQSWHEKGTGRCTYGHEHVMRGCTCPGFGKRKQAVAVVENGVRAGMSLERAIDDVIRALTVLKREIGHRDVKPEKPTVNGGGKPDWGHGTGRLSSKSPINTITLNLSLAERKILTVLAQHPNGLTKQQIALMTGYRMSGGFRNSLSSLRTASRIEGDGDTRKITKRGLDDLGIFTPLPTGRQLLAYWEDNAGGKCERVVLSQLAAIYPSTATQHELANVTGYQPSGGFRNAVSRLRTLQLITGKKSLVLTTAFANAIRE